MVGWVGGRRRGGGIFLLDLLLVQVGRRGRRRGRGAFLLDGRAEVGMVVVVLMRHAHLFSGRSTANEVNKKEGNEGDQEEKEKKENELRGIQN